MPEDLRKVKFSARITKQTKAHVIEQARAHNMKPSFYADIALALFRMDDVGQELVKQ